MIEISLTGACEMPHCGGIVKRVKDELDVPRLREGVSLLPVPEDIEEWEAAHRTARKRVMRAARKGYDFHRIVTRSLYEGDILAINRSMPVRQGRPMHPGYETPPLGDLPPSGCPYHDIAWYAVTLGFGVWGYCTAYHCGEVTNISQFLVHGAALDDGAAYLLMRGVLSRCPPGVLFYNRHDSGTDGLRWFKERCGFRPADVRWVV